MTAPVQIGVPFALDGRGLIASSGPADHIAQMIELVLTTSPGERVNRPDFGAGITRMLFEAASSLNAEALALELRAVLTDQFRGLMTLNALTTDIADNRLQLSISYTLLSGEKRTARYAYDLPG